MEIHNPCKVLFITDYIEMDFKSKLIDYKGTSNTLQLSETSNVLSNNVYEIHKNSKAVNHIVLYN